jgi:hypothetical protein
VGMHGHAATEDFPQTAAAAASIEQQQQQQ